MPVLWSQGEGGNPAAHNILHDGRTVRLAPPGGADALGIAVVVIDEASEYLAGVIARMRDPRPVFRLPEFKTMHHDPRNFEKPERVGQYIGKARSGQKHLRTRVKRRSLDVTSTAPFAPREAAHWLGRLGQALADHAADGTLPASAGGGGD